MLITVGAKTKKKIYLVLLLVNSLWMHDSFLIAGHTKFSPDWCFGLIKQLFRRRYVSSLFDLMEAVDQSTVTGVNISKLCGLHDGTILVPVYDG